MLYPSYCIIPGLHSVNMIITGDVNVDHLVKEAAAKFLYNS